jgi:hypothetical protein
MVREFFVRAMPHVAAFCPENPLRTIAQPSIKIKKRTFELNPKARFSINIQCSVEDNGFEPIASCMPCKRSTK